MKFYQALVFKLILLILLLSAASLVQAQKRIQFKRLSREVLWDKIYASWLGQMVGNIYGLPHENQYIDEPGPDKFPYGYTRNLDRLKKINGAFSDDDTDIEYIYLLQMEKYGPEPTYSQLTSAWRYHIRKNVWLANRAALGLMHFGYTPPFTGNRESNPHWFQIDPQLVNEIWGVTAPGMVKYAAEKSAWAARITNDGWGIEPTIHYGAMFAAAFFESDVNKLIDHGVAALPPGSRFAMTVEDVKQLYKKFPTDWQRARKVIAEKYYINEPSESKTIWNANLNAACGILALLYGQGDFQSTLDLACAMGFDADNQAATMCGLLGAMGGTKVIPRDLLYPVAGWEKPFNDIYMNVTRYDMPDETITGIANKSFAQAKAIILKGGGSAVTENEKEHYLINTEATFTPPFELGIGPMPLLEVGRAIEGSLGLPTNVTCNITAGKLPPGVTLSESSLKGKPTTPGVYPVSIEGSFRDQHVRSNLNLLVRGRNLAGDATEVLSNVTRTNISSRDSMWLSVSQELYAPAVSVIRDGRRKGKQSVFYSIDGTHQPKQDYYGYKWDTEKNIGLISYSTGSMEENGGWFTSLQVEYLDGDGAWQPVKKLIITPELITGNEPYNKPHFVEYLLVFEPVKSRGIRIIGNAGGSDHWYSKKTWFTSITELCVYEPIPSIEKVSGKSWNSLTKP